MRLSRRADYALRAVRHCAGLPKGAVGSITAISVSESVPREFLAKVLNDLTQSKILVSFKGIKGGYAMALKPKDVSFLDVIEAVDGPVHLNLCTDHKSGKGEHPKDCAMCGFWEKQEASFKKALKAHNFGRYATGRR